MTDQGLDVLTLEQCVARLEEHRVGRIALLVDEYPLIVPVNYRLVMFPGEHWIVIRTRSHGVIERADRFVAFEIDDVDAVRREGWSVVVRGTLHHVDPDAADFSRRFDPDSWLPGGRDAWMVVKAFQITGRALRNLDRDWELEARPLVAKVPWLDAWRQDGAPGPGSGPNARPEICSMAICT